MEKYSEDTLCAYMIGIYQVEIHVLEAMGDDLRGRLDSFLLCLRSWWS